MKTNKILTFVITLVFACVSVLACFPSLIAGAATISLTDSDYENAREVLSLICPDFPLNEGEVTTRAEFVAAVTGLMNIPMTEVTETGFGDVLPEDKYAANIKYAAGLGLISNVDLFYPDSPVTYAQAVKIVMTAAGYGRKAEYTGGFPTGYLMMANDADVGLGLGISNDETLSHKDATALIYDAVTTDMMEAAAFGDTFEYTVREGKNILSAYHHIFMADGIVEANENTGLLSMAGAAGEDEIKIDGKTYTGAGYQNLIGKRTRVLFDKENKNTIIYAYELENKVTEYTEKDGFVISGTTLTVAPHNKDRDERYSLQPTYSYLYNGKYYGGTDINPTSGTVSLVDNDDDGVIEVIIVKDFSYGIVSSVNEFEEKIYDKYKAQGVLDLGDSSVRYLVSEADGTAISLGDLEADDIIGCAISNDNKFYEIVRFDSRIGGTFEAVADGKLVLKGEEYTLSPYYTTNVKNLSNIKLGSEIILYLGASNQVVFVEEFSTDIKYGLLIDAGRLDGLDGKYMVKLFSQDGEMLEVSLAEKVKYNGTLDTALNVKTNIENNIVASATPIYMRVCKYALNEAGELKTVLTTVLNTDGPDVYTRENIAEAQPVLYTDNLAMKLDDDGNPELDGETNEIIYELINPFHRNGVFFPYFASAAGSVAIKAPNDDAYKNVNKYYSICSPSELDEEGIYAFGYDVDKNGAALILNPLAVGVAASTVTGEPASAIVESVTTGMNDEGETVTVANMYRSGEWKKYYANDDTEAAMNALKPGDIVCFMANSFDEITAIETHFSFANNKTFYQCARGSDPDYVDTVDIKGISGRYIGYVGGYVYNFSGGKATIVRGDIAGADPTGNEIYKDINEVDKSAQGIGVPFKTYSIYPISVNVSKTVFVKFINDRATGKTLSAQVYKEADMSSVETYFNSGLNADYMVSRERFHDVYLNIVYVNEYVN